MFDSDYDPYDEIESCKYAIRQLCKSIEALVEANNLQATVIEKNKKEIDLISRRMLHIQTQIDNEIK